MVSIESEKRAVRDCHGPVKSEAKFEAFFPLPIGTPKLDMVEGDPNDSEFRQHRKVKITESNLEVSEDIMSSLKMPRIQPLPIVSNESPSHTVGSNTQELQNITNMILSLQLDLQEERSKR